jgi:2,3-bisphosphoglycerate-independent phosphoglycerate mutase
MPRTKSVVILIDGAADYPIEALGGKTPLQAARKPAIDALAREAEIGLVQTIPEGLPAGSDTANLSIFGYDPVLDYTGRSSLEAVSMGVDLADGDVTFRCNLVTLSDDGRYEDRTMIDYSAGEIPTEQSRSLITGLSGALDSATIRFFPGISYRHLIVWHGGPQGSRLTPPHDISGKRIGDYLPEGAGRDVLLGLMVRSPTLLKDHPVNRARIAAGSRPANAIWIWGEGRKPALAQFSSKYGVGGTVISAVDLVKGIAICAGLKPVSVPGATGNIHTNFAGKAESALAELRRGGDFVYLHIEAPDECGHQGDISGKVRSIELIDEKVVRPIKAGLDALGGPYRIMILPDHPTPISKRTHTSEPVPFMIYDSARPSKSGPHSFDEASAAASGLFLPVGHLLMGRFLEK